MTCIVRSDDRRPLALMEQNEQASILQNIAVLLGTKKGTVPMYRDFGLPMEYIGKPMTIAETLLLNEVTEAVRKFEPRATVNECSLKINDDNQYVAELEVEI